MIGACSFFTFFCMQRLTTTVNFLRQLLEDFPVEKEFLVPLLKILGISYSAEFSSSLCKDSGHEALGTQVELFAKLTIVVLCLPGLSYLIQIMEGIF